MKKIFSVLFLLISCASFSNAVFDYLAGPRWTCVGPSYSKLIFLIISKNGNNKYSAALNQTDNFSKPGESVLHVGEFELALNEKENYFYFTNLNKKSQIFSSYRFNYTTDKKNRVKFSLYDTSENRHICNFSAK